MSGIIFVYVDSKKNVSIQHIHNIAENDIYIQGISLLPQDEGGLKSFRKDRVVAELGNFPEEPLQLIATVNPLDFFPLHRTKETFDICFTGFKKDRRSALEVLAQNNNMLVRKSVTQKLQVLCCGENAGPSKISSARKMNVIIFNESQFLSFLETGEIVE